MTGPRAITLHEVAEELSWVTSRNIAYHAEPLEWEVEGWVTSYEA